MHSVELMPFFVKYDHHMHIYYWQNKSRIMSEIYMKIFPCIETLQIEMAHNLLLVHLTISSIGIQIYLHAAHFSFPLVRTKSSSACLVFSFSFSFFF